MAEDDLKLIFETERRILQRRLKELLPGRGSSPPAGDEEEERAEEGRPRRGGESAGKRGRSRPRRRWAGTQGVNLAISLVIHLVLLGMILPAFRLEDAGDEPPRSFSIRFVARENPPEEEPTPPETPAPPEVAEPDEVPPKEPESQAVSPAEETPEEPATPVAPPTPAPELLGSGGGGTPAEGRSPLGARYGERPTALRIYGGDEETERAVREGLEGLARHQEPDGSWDPEGFPRHCAVGIRCSGPGFQEYRAGITALALLAFLGAGIDGRRDLPHKDVVRRGLDYLLSVQDSTGCFGPRRGQYMYSHAITSFCVAEAAILTGDSRYRARLREALRFSARAQQPGGGWDYTAARTLRNDLSVSGWQVMAIHSARGAGVPIDPEMERRLKRYVRRAAKRSGWSIYADQGTGRGRRGISIAAVGLLSRLYLGWSPRSDETIRAANLLIHSPPDSDARVDWERTYQSTYYWYYATLALFHIGGEFWEAWNVLLKRTVLPLQRKKGEMRGSWNPDPNWIGASGGRITSTALGILILEVYYRYTPLYRQLGLGAGKEGEPSSEQR
ncbi:MAG: prenyltransferase/squalene oxidase repeat-containing protein [Planctomycetota bacterium]